MIDDSQPNDSQFSQSLKVDEDEGDSLKEESTEDQFLVAEGYKASRNLPSDINMTRLEKWKKTLSVSASMNKINNVCQFLEEHGLLVLNQSYKEAEKEYELLRRKDTGSNDESLLRVALEKCEKLLRGILVYGTKRLRRGALDLADGLYRHLDDM